VSNTPSIDATTTLAFLLLLLSVDDVVFCGGGEQIKEQSGYKQQQIPVTKQYTPIR